MFYLLAMASGLSWRIVVVTEDFLEEGALGCVCVCVHVQVLARAHYISMPQFCV